MTTVGIRQFTYQALPMRVVFGPGSRKHLSDEIATLGLGRVLVICSPEQRDLGESVSADLGDASIGLLARAQMHVPVELAEHAVTRVADGGAVGCVAVGGGSAIGLAKAVARRRDVSIVALPTTYAGSEMTPVWGETADCVKTTGRDVRVLPRSVVYDPELTLTLPISLSLTSGLNAIAHAVEALYAPDVTPVIALQAAEGIRALATSLPDVVADGQDLLARSDAQYGAWLCGTCLAATTMSLHHKLCHSLGGALDLPHADTHSIVLPYVLAFNAPAVPGVVETLASALDSPQPVLALRDLSRLANGPTSLRELGMRAEDIPRVRDLALRSSYANPRQVTPDAVESILRAAWAGEPPVVET